MIEPALDEAGAEEKPASPTHALGGATPSVEFLALIHHEFARRHLILSAGWDAARGFEILCIGASTSMFAVHNTGVALARPIEVRRAADDELAVAIDSCYRRAQESSEQGDPADDHDAPRRIEHSDATFEDAVALAMREDDQDVLHTSGKSPAMLLVDLVLFEAISKGASDVHVQPLREATLIRYRLDGALHTVRRLPTGPAASVISRIKVMAGLDVAEHRMPQDGRAAITVGLARDAGVRATVRRGRRVDLRVSTLPSTYGERIVMRILDTGRSPHLLSFERLGMPDPVRQRYQDHISRTSGIVLSTGPTGSGKTTTLYTTLSWIIQSNAGDSARGCELNILTIEDPVEFDLAGQAVSNKLSGLTVSQTQVDPHKNMTFATGLRHILRQDPDVIMVGEIRDADTARIAVQAALTGHLVLSTLHTNDAASAVARLIDLGVEPFLVASALTGVLAQRLVRLTHGPCAGRGCDVCHATGFKGRTGIFELLTVDEMQRNLIIERRSASAIKAAAMSAGMIPLLQVGRELVRTGATTARELGRVLESGENDSDFDGASP